MLDFLSDEVKAQLTTVNSDDGDSIRKVTMGRPTRKQAWCVKHGQECPLPFSALHVSGTPCVRHSTTGKQEGLKGKNSVVYFAWCRQRVDCKEAT